MRKLYDARTWMLRLPVSSNGVISTSDMDIGARGAPPQELHQTAANLVIRDYSQGMAPKDERMVSHVVNFLILNKKSRRLPPRAAPPLRTPPGVPHPPDPRARCRRGVQ